MTNWAKATLAAAAVLTLGPAAPAAEPADDAGRLAGTWLFDAASVRAMSELPRFWTSTLTVTGDSFALSKLMGVSKDLKGRITLDPKAAPKTIDLVLEELDLSELGVRMKLPAGTVKGVYE